MPVIISDNGRLKTPPTSVPANRFVPEATRAKTFVFVKPSLTAVQLAPVLEERNTPPYVPTKIFIPLTTNVCTSHPKVVRPAVTRVQFVPYSVVR